MNTTQVKTQRKVYFHGTSADNLQSILKHGISCSEPKLWNVSEDVIYLWDAEKVAASNDYTDTEDIEREGFRMACESGQFALAASKDCRIVVLRIELDESEVFADTSSDNMEGMGAVCINRDIQPYEIIEINLSNDLSLLKGYFMCLASNNEYSDIEFTDIEKRILKAFANSEIYPEDIEYMIEWEIVNQLELA